MRWHAEGHDRVTFLNSKWELKGATGFVAYGEGDILELSLGIRDLRHHITLAYLLTHETTRKALDEDSRGEAALTCSPVSLLAQILLVSS